MTPKAVKGGAQGSPAGGGFLTRLRREKPLAVVLGSVLLLLIGVALFADVLAPFCARLTLGVGLAATAVNVLVALVVGGVSGFIGGRLDLTVQRLVDAWMSIPGLLILLTVMSVVGRGVLQIIVVLGVLGGIGGSRVVRGAVIGAKEQVYFEAARAVGSSRWRTLLRHLLPNIAPVLIVIYSINIGAVVISEASLSFLGFGLPTNGAELGRHAEPRGAPVHGDRAAAGGVVGPVSDRGGVLPEHGRRRGARPARPAPARRPRPPRRTCSRAGAATACARRFGAEPPASKTPGPATAGAPADKLAATEPEWRRIRSPLGSGMRRAWFCAEPGVAR